MSVTSFLHYKRPNPWHIVYHLQVIYARFGSKPHIIMIFFALLTNLLIAGMVMSEGSVIMATLTDGKSCIIISWRFRVMYVCNVYRYT